MRRFVSYWGVALILLGVGGGALGAPLLPPTYTEPFNTDTLGNSASNFLGSFRQNGGPRQFRYFIGTNLIAGSLIMDFAPFIDGPGNKFAILTNSQAWGPLADTARFEFFLGGNLQASFTAPLAPDQLFQFDLPGSGLLANRVVVTNITPNPPGITNLAEMTFDDAGVAFVVPEPSAVTLFGLGALGLLGYVWRRRGQVQRGGTACLTSQ